MRSRKRGATLLILSLFWLLIGLFIGALANAAKLRPAA